MIKTDTIWVNIKTGIEVLVIWVSDELVTYQASGNITPTPMRIFMFLQDFEPKSR